MRWLKIREKDWLPSAAAALVAGVLLGSSIAALQPVPAGAMTLVDVLNDTPRRIVSYCIDSTPSDVSDTQAETLLNQAIAHREVTGGIDGYPAVNLSQDAPCVPSTDVRVRSEASFGVVAEVNAPGNTTITFGDEYAFWDGIGSRSSWEFSYEGVLVHEMGHTMGIGHSGSGSWTYDGGALPSMTQCGNATDSQWLDTLQQDDWGVAVNIGGRATGKTPFWNANPGFERGTSYWYRSSSGITANSAYKNTGGLGVRIPAINGYLFMTSVYDPYHPIENPVDNMDLTPVLHVRSDYRHKYTSTTGGIWVQYNWRYLRYDGTTCKSVTTPTHTGWSGVTTALSCGDRGTTWSSCDGSVSINSSTTNDATVFRAYVKSRSSFHVYIDRTGAYGGTE